MNAGLLSRRADFNFGPYLKAIEAELAGMDFTVEVTERVKNVETPIESAFIKAGTKESLLKIEVPEDILTHVVRSLKIEIMATRLFSGVVDGVQNILSFLCAAQCQRLVRDHSYPEKYRGCRQTDKGSRASG